MTAAVVSRTTRSGTERVANVWYARPVNGSVPNANVTPVLLSGRARSATEWGRYVLANGLPGVTYQITCRHDRHGWLNAGELMVPA